MNQPELLEYLRQRPEEWVLARDLAHEASKLKQLHKYGLVELRTILVGKRQQIQVKYKEQKVAYGA